MAEAGARGIWGIITYVVFFCICIKIAIPKNKQIQTKKKNIKGRKGGKRAPLLHHGSIFCVLRVVSVS